MLELGGQREDPEELDLAQRRLQQLVVGGHRLVGDVVVARDPTQLRALISNTRKQRRRFVIDLTNALSLIIRAEN